jgi:hypothetical protein
MPEQFGRGPSAHAAGSEKDNPDWDLQQLPSFRGPPPALKPAPQRRDTRRIRRISGSPHWPAFRALLLLAGISGVAAVASAHLIPPGQIPPAASNFVATLRGLTWRENTGPEAGAPGIKPNHAEPAPGSPAVPPPASVRPAIPSELASLAIERGDELMSLGDVASARRFYQMAAEGGLAAAALALARSYDPRYLDRIGAIGVRGDAAKAAQWYRRAAEPNDRSPAVP